MPPWLYYPTKLREGSGDSLSEGTVWNCNWNPDYGSSNLFYRRPHHITLRFSVSDSGEVNCESVVEEQMVIL